jgi:UDP-N-acetylglucosamine 2-epimerase
MTEAVNPYDNGKASERICEILKKYSQRMTSYKVKKMEKKIVLIF